MVGWLRGMLADAWQHGHSTSPGARNPYGEPAVRPSVSGDVEAWAESTAMNRGSPKLVRASRHLDLELAARSILRTLPPGSLSAPPSAVAMLQKKLTELAQAIWTQGWDCREERGPLAGAFGHANRYNPYREPLEERKCRACGAMPLLTERGRCEDCGDCQGCNGDGCTTCEATGEKS